MESSVITFLFIASLNATALVLALLQLTAKRYLLMLTFKLLKAGCQAIHHWHMNPIHHYHTHKPESATRLNTSSRRYVTCYLLWNQLPRDLSLPHPWSLWFQRGNHTEMLPLVQYLFFSRPVFMSQIPTTALTLNLVLTYLILLYSSIC